MKKWIARAMVTTVVAGGALSVTLPAHAGWVSGGVYASKSSCDSVGKARVRSGQYETYVCEAQNPGWWLRGYQN